MNKITVDSKTFWQILQGKDGFLLAVNEGDIKAYYHGVPVYIENDI